MENCVWYIKNALVVLPAGILRDGVIVIKEGKISDVGCAGEVSIPKGALCIDAKEAYVGPGFVDIHVHGVNGYSTCFQPEQAAAHFLKHGTTTLLGTPDYHMDLERILEAIHSIRKAMKNCPVIKGIYMEGPYTNPNYGSHADTNPWHCGVREADYKPMVDACGSDVRVWTVAAERPDLKPFLDYALQVNPNVKIAIGHSQATPEQIRALGTHRPTIHTHIFNATGRIPVPAGTRGYGPDEYSLQQPEVFAELISDSCGIHVHPDLQRLLLHCKGVDKIVLITDSTVHNNPVPDHLSHIKDLNFDSNGGIAGSKMTMDIACKNIMASTNCSIVQAFLMASTNPARAVGLYDTVGAVEVGKSADLVFVDDTFNVQQVMLRGEMQ